MLVCCCLDIVLYFDDGLSVETQPPKIYLILIFFTQNILKLKKKFRILLFRIFIYFDDDLSVETPKASPEPGNKIQIDFQSIMQTERQC